MSGICAALDGGPPIPTFVAAGTGAREVPGAGGQLDIPYPATILAGDFLLALIYMQDATAVAAVSVPSGWTQAGSTLTDAGGTRRCFCIWDLASGSESGNLAVTMANANVDVFSAGRMFQFRGASQINTSSQASTDASGTTMALPSITPTNYNCLLVGLCAANGSTTYATSGSFGYVEDVAEYAPGANVTIAECSLPVHAPALAPAESGTLGAGQAFRCRFHFALHF